jgi:hypothetical protein
MKLRQNARELVLLSAEGLGLILGEIRYNRQTETAVFALEKAAYFDVYFPCAVVYDQQKGPVVHPHVLTTFTTSSIRVQRLLVSYFVMENDLNPALIRQYQELIQAVLAQGKIPDKPAPREDESPDRPRPTGSRIIDLTDRREKPDQ